MLIKIFIERISFTSFPLYLIFALMILQGKESQTSDFASSAHSQNSLSQIQTSVDVVGQLRFLVSEQLKKVN
jgi:hypothetical protein